MTGQLVVLCPEKEEWSGQLGLNGHDTGNHSAGGRTLQERFGRFNAFLRDVPRGFHALPEYGVLLGRKFKPRIGLR